MTRDAWIFKRSRAVSLLMCGRTNIHSIRRKEGLSEREARRLCLGVTSTVLLTEAVLVAAGAGGISGRLSLTFVLLTFTRNRVAAILLTITSST